MYSNHKFENVPLSEELQQSLVEFQKVYRCATGICWAFVLNNLNIVISEDFIDLRLEAPGIIWSDLHMNHKQVTCISYS